MLSLGVRLTIAAVVTALVVASVAGLMLVLLLTGAAGGRVAQEAAAAPPGCIPGIGLPINPGDTRNPTTGQYVVTSEYGMRVQPVTGEYRLHAGIDLSQTGGGHGPIVAAQAGRVVEVGSKHGPGQYVNIDHGGGFKTRYLHLARIDVDEGQTVAAGEQIGLEGNTGGISTGAHLHFETVFNGEPRDPREWFAANGIEVPARGGTGVAPPPGEAEPQPTAVAIPASWSTTAPTEGDVPLDELPEEIAGYSGEQLVNAVHIIVAGDDLGLDPYTISLGVMTAMGESSLYNIDHGDEAGPDSRGLFQQRSSWGTEEERMHPPTASRFFFEALLQVEGYEDLPPTIAAHRTQRNADPYHYEPFFDPAVTVVSVIMDDPDFRDRVVPPGCGAPRPPMPGDGSGEAIVEAAQAYAGTDYSWGGGDINGPTLGTYRGPGWDGRNIVGFDCSGLVLFAVYQATGVELPHSAEIQRTMGSPVPRQYDQMLPGDVIGFSTRGGAAGTFDHIGIYAGDGKMIHAPVPGDVVKIEQLQGSSYWEGQHWEVRRFAIDEELPTPDGGQAGASTGAREMEPSR